MSIGRVSGSALFSVAVAYAALGGLGLALAIGPGYASPVFPAAGLALAIALRFGAGVLPAIWIASLALNTGLAAWHGSLSPGTALVAVGMASGATLQAWLGRHLVLRGSLEKWQRLEHEADMFRFFLRGGVLACLVSATCGVSSLAIAGIVPAGDLGFIWWTWYVGDTLGVLIVAPLVIGWLHRKDSVWQPRLKTMAAPVLVMLLLATVAFLGTARWEGERQHSAIDDQGAELASALERRFIAHREMLAALARAIEIKPDLSLDQFDHFTAATLRDQPDIFGLSFNPYVTRARRTEFERRMAAIYPDGKFQITERSAAGQITRAGDRPEYVTVGYISPLSGNSRAIGFDIHSEPRRRAAITRARQSGQVTVTEPIRLVQEQQERPGALILAPAFRPGLSTGQKAAGGELAGFGVAVIKIDEMVEIATRGLLAPGLVFSLEDPATDPAMRELYRSDSSAASAAGDPAWQKTLMMADREWVLKLFVTDAYRQAHRSWMAWGIGVAGLMFAALLQMLLLAVTGRTALIQRQVADQTEEIRAKNEALLGYQQHLENMVEQRTAELNDARLHLEQKVEARTAALEMAQRTLLQSKQAAEVASRAKSEFLATMSARDPHPHERRAGLPGPAPGPRLPSCLRQPRASCAMRLSSAALMRALLDDLLDCHEDRGRQAQSW
jgi:CHASE1-domain containing sensor protein